MEDIRNWLDFSDEEYNTDGSGPLTMEITLREFRELHICNVDNVNRIERLQKDNQELREDRQNLANRCEVQEDELRRMQADNDALAMAVAERDARIEELEGNGGPEVHDATCLDEFNGPVEDAEDEDPDDESA